MFDCLKFFIVVIDNDQPIIIDGFHWPFVDYAKEIGLLGCNSV